MISGQNPSSSQILRVKSSYPKLLAKTQLSICLIDKQMDNWVFANSFDHFRDIELESMGILYLLDFRREALEF